MNIQDAVDALASVQFSASRITARTKRSDNGQLELVVQFHCAPDIEALVQLFRLGCAPGPMLVTIRATQYELLR